MGKFGKYHKLVVPQSPQHLFGAFDVSYYRPGLMFRRDHPHRRSPVPRPWITPRGDLDYLRSVVKKVIRAAELRDELSFISFRHGGFTEGADADMSDAELRAAGRHRSARQLPTYAKRTRNQPISGAKKRRAIRTNAGNLSE